MDIKAYIESGILERYVLGEVSDQEQREVECMSSIYPELQEELILLQEGMEAMANRLKVAVPASVKENLLNEIKSTPQESSMKVLKTSSSEDLSSKQNPSKVHYFAYAAAVLAIVFLSAQYFTSMQESEKLAQELQETKEQLGKEYQEQVAALEMDLNQSEERSGLLASKDTRTVVLEGSDFSPKSKVRVFWNKTEQAYLLMADELPKPSAGMQYQLWAIADGVPISVALLNENEGVLSPQEIQLQSVQAFAITLEVEGGVEQPTLEQLMVIGNT